MNLCYRGVEYKPTQVNLEFTEEVIGRYRGAVVSRCLARNVPHRRVEGLTYRGAKIR